MKKPYLTDTDLIDALLLISEAAKTLAKEVKLLPKEGEQTMKSKQCMRCATHKSVANDMYLIGEMVVCEDCAFNICEEEYFVKTQNTRLYFDNENKYIGSSLGLDNRDVIRLTFKKHQVKYKLLEPSQNDLKY